MKNRDNDDWVIVYTTSTEVEALLIKGMLENEDIPAQVLSQIDTTRQFTLGALSVAKIYVQQSNFENAKRLIEEHEKM